MKLQYPLYFGSKTVVGKFEDKLSTSSRGNERSYPRFESDEQILEIDNIGQGIRYKGGFRLQGLTVYGFGNKNIRAANLPCMSIVFRNSIIFKTNI